MTNLTGYDSSFSANALLDVPIILIGSSSAYYATTGGPIITIPSEWDNLPFDGKQGIPVAGLDRRRMDTVPSIEGTFAEFEAAKAPDLIPGATVTTISTSVFRLTPKNYGEFLSASTDYQANVFAFERRGAGWIGIHFPIAIVLPQTIQGETPGQGGIAVRIEPRQSSTATDVGASPWSFVHGTGTIAAAYTALTA